MSFSNTHMSRRGTVAMKKDGGYFVFTWGVGASFVGRRNPVLCEFLVVGWNP